jgi:hypothetical protein
MYGRIPTPIGGEEWEKERKLVFSLAKEKPMKECIKKKIKSLRPTTIAATSRIKYSDSSQEQF